MKGVKSAVLVGIVALHAALGCCVHHAHAQTLAECHRGDGRKSQPGDVLVSVYGASAAKVSGSHSASCPLEHRENCEQLTCLYDLKSRSRLLDYCDSPQQTDLSTAGPFNSAADQASHIVGPDDLLSRVSKPVRLYLLKQVLLL